MDSLHKMRNKDLKIYDVIKSISAQYPEYNAINCLNLTYTYKELIDDTIMYIRAFHELGIKEKDVVSISMPNFYEAVCAYLALSKIGAVTTFLNPNIGFDREIKLLNQLETEYLINYNKTTDYNKNIKNFTNIRNIITLQNYELGLKRKQGISHLLGYTDYLKFGDIESLSHCNNFMGSKKKNNDSLLFITSSINGKMNQVLLNDRQILNTFSSKEKKVVNFNNKQKSLVTVPFYYKFGFVDSLLNSLVNGFETILAPNISRVNVDYYYRKNPNIVYCEANFVELSKNNINNYRNLSSINTIILNRDNITDEIVISIQEFYKKYGCDVKLFDENWDEYSVVENKQKVMK